MSFRILTFFLFLFIFIIFFKNPGKLFPRRFLRCSQDGAFGFSLFLTAIWYFIQCLCPTLFLHSPVNEHLICWHLSNVTNNILMHILVQITPWTHGWEFCATVHLQVKWVERGNPVISCCIITIPQLRDLKQQFGFLSQFWGLAGLCWGSCS